MDASPTDRAFVAVDSGARHITTGQRCEKRYGCARVVFDGYGAPSTKDAEHSIRVASSREVIIEDNIHVSMSQQEFSGNTANKVRFIALLTSHLEGAGCEVHHASAAADRLIVLTASAVHPKGKCVPFRKRQAQPALCTVVQVFNDPQASKNAVAAAGEAFLCVVYGGKIDDNLDVKRHLDVKRYFTCGPLRNRKCVRNSTWQLCHQRQQLHVNTRSGCTTKYRSGVVSP